MREFVWREYVPGNEAHDEIVWRRFGSDHDKPCNRPEIITCAMPECQYANACQAMIARPARHEETVK